MTIITIDAETYWDQDYTLTKMTTVEYVLDPRFELILLGVKVDDGPVQMCRGEADARRLLDKISALYHGWEKLALLSHNANFDMAILAWKFGIVPKLYLDTLSMARAKVHAYTGSSSLANVAKYFEFAPKGTEAVKNKGRWLASFSPAELSLYMGYCAHDTNLCKMIFNKLMAEGFPKSELRLIDLSIRKYLEPHAKLNPLKLAEHLANVRADKAQAMAQVGAIDKKVFASNKQFAELLASEGIRVPTKISPANGERTYALAKSDPEFRALCDNPDLPPRVQAMLQVRLNTKSTGEETRSETLLRLSQRDWNGMGARWMPVPYKYYGAHTGRFSGDGGFNLTNLKRRSPLRDAIEAPDKHWRIVHRDSSQIEARMLAWLAVCPSLLGAFAEDTDIYSQFAGIFYSRSISKADVLERFVGKTCILGLGYGAGWVKLKSELFVRGGIDLGEAEVRLLVGLYRNTYAEIPALWFNAGVTLDRMVGLDTQPHTPGIPVVKRTSESIVLPNGMALRYPGLTRNGKELNYRVGLSWRKIYGAKLCENITQALARIIITDIELKVYKETGRRPFMSTYDSHDYMVPVGEVEAFDRYLEEQFKQAPDWAPGLPLSSEGGWGRTLLAAEEHADD